MHSTPGWWRQFHRAEGHDPGPLVIFPHAGSGASAYRAFAQELSRAFDVYVCQYPGRQDRAAEPAHSRIGDLAAGAYAAWCDAGLATRPLTVFGHSMGAFVAFEFVRLAEADGVPVRLLCPSAAVAPMRAADLPPHPRDDEGLLDHLALLSGTGDDVLGSREIMRMTLPVLRADYGAFDDYTCALDVRVAAPMHVLGGADDPLITVGTLYEWQSHTAAPIAVTQFDGGHFYFHAHGAAAAELLARVVSPVG